jgi:hypothetical protein
VQTFWLESLEGRDNWATPATSAPTYNHGFINCKMWVQRSGVLKYLLHDVCSCTLNTKSLILYLLKLGHKCEDPFPLRPCSCTRMVKGIPPVYESKHEVAVGAAADRVFVGFIISLAGWLHLRTTCGESARTLSRYTV